MQPRRIIAGVFAAVAFGAPSVRAATATSAAAARLWLQEHPAAQGDELAELKDQNPEAYAIVKALLTKRSLGLLDPKHPSASFAAPPPSAAQDAPSGAAAFAKFESPSKQANNVQLAYPDAAVAPHHMDMFNWKPSSSAMDDEAMVQNVLGAVAELKGKAPTKSLLSKQQESSATADSSLAADESAFAAEVSAPPAAPAAPSAPAATENSYLKGIDFGAATADPAPASSGNSNLRGLGAAAQPAPINAHDSQQADGSDALASFSWDDDSKPVQAAPAPHLVQQQSAVKQQSSTNNVLSSWLFGGSAKAAAPPAAAAAAPVATDKASNPYTAGLW